MSDGRKEGDTPPVEREPERLALYSAIRLAASASDLIIPETSDTVVAVLAGVGIGDGRAFVVTLPTVAGAAGPLPPVSLGVLEVFLTTGGGSVVPYLDSCGTVEGSLATACLCSLTALFNADRILNAM